MHVYRLVIRIKRIVVPGTCNDVLYVTSSSTNSCMYYTGVPGIISGIDVDTSYFTGNYSPQVSIQAAVLSKGKASPTKENNTIFFLKVKKE